MGTDAKMLMRVPTEVTDDQLKLWSWDLCAAVGADKFYLGLYKEVPGALRRLAEHESDSGGVLLPELGGALVEIALRTRYYGVGYERGDLLTLCAVAEWCEQNVPGCEVWYGGDSVDPVPWPEEERRKLRAHLFSTAGRAYYDYDARSSLPRDDSMLPPIADCPACVPGRRPNRYGWGAAFAKYHCPGCGRNFETHDKGATWAVKNG